MIKIDKQLSRKHLASKVCPLDIAANLEAAPHQLYPQVLLELPLLLRPVDLSLKASLYHVQSKSCQRCHQQIQALVPLCVHLPFVLLQALF